MHYAIVYFTLLITNRLLSVSQSVRQTVITSNTCYLLTPPPPPPLFYNDTPLIHAVMILYFPLFLFLTTSDDGFEGSFNTLRIQSHSSSALVRGSTCCCCCSCCCRCCCGGCCCCVFRGGGGVYAFLCLHKTISFAILLCEFHC